MNQEATLDFPRPTAISPGKIIYFTEDVFIKKDGHYAFAGTRKSIAEVVLSAGPELILGDMRIRIIKSEGFNAFPKSAIIDRPAANLQKGFQLSGTEAMEEFYFKSGGMTADAEHMQKVGGYNVGVDASGQVIATTDGTKGGMGVGRSHAEDGIKATVKGSGQTIEYEGGEMILTKKAAEDNRQYDYQGKKMTARQIASDLNVKNGGISFAEKGIEIPSACKCSGNKFEFGGKMLSDYEIIKQMNDDCGCDHSDEHSPLYWTLSKLNAGAITIGDALKEISQTKN